MSITIKLKSARGDDNRELQIGNGDDDTILLAIGSTPEIPVFRADLHRALTVLDKWDRVPQTPQGE